MSKYICDFDALRTIAINLKKFSSDMNSTITPYESNIQSDLNGWTGTAKESFSQGLSSQIESAKTYAKSVDELSNFITKAVDTIEAKEAEIAALNI